LIDENQFAENMVHDPGIRPLRSAACRAEYREHEREEQRMAKMENSNPCNCTWEPPTPEEKYDQETVGMYRSKMNGWDDQGKFTYDREKMTRRG